jgi:hypothetical protein
VLRFAEGEGAGAYLAAEAVLDDVLGLCTPARGCQGLLHGRDGAVARPGGSAPRRHLEHDLRNGRTRLSGAALLSDAESVFFGELPWESLAVPVRLLHAEWSVGTGSPPAYSADAVDQYRDKTAAVVLVGGVDHAGSIMTRTGARATAQLLTEAIMSQGPDQGRPPASRP